MVWPSECASTNCTCNNINKGCPYPLLFSLCAPFLCTPPPPFGETPFSMCTPPLCSPLPSLVYPLLYVHPLSLFTAFSCVTPSLCAPPPLCSPPSLCAPLLYVTPSLLFLMCLLLFVPFSCVPTCLCVSLSCRVSQILIQSLQDCVRGIDEQAANTK